MTRLVVSSRAPDARMLEPGLGLHLLVRLKRHVLSQAKSPAVGQPQNGPLLEWDAVWATAHKPYVPLFTGNTTTLYRIVVRRSAVNGILPTSSGQGAGHAKAPSAAEKVPRMVIPGRAESGRIRNPCQSRKR